MTAKLLFGIDFPVDFVTLELTVPSEFVVLSSYRLWNEVLEFVLENQAVPEDEVLLTSMLSPPHPVDKFDDVQATIPFLDDSWISDVRPLIVDNRASTDLV